MNEALRATLVEALEKVEDGPALAEKVVDITSWCQKGLETFCTPVAPRRAGSTFERKSVVTKNVREMNENDISVLFQNARLKQSSYFILHSVLGYSLTEWKVECLERLRKSYRDLVVEEPSSTLWGAIRLGPEDTISRMIRVQPLVLSVRPEGETLMQESLKSVIEKLFLFKNITRFCSFIFPWEEEEKRLLEGNGFEKEGVLSRQIYFRGVYHDLLMFGTDRGKWDE